MCGFCGDDGGMGIEIGREKGKFNRGNDRETLTWFVKKKKKVIKGIARWMEDGSERVGS